TLPPCFADSKGTVPTHRRDHVLASRKRVRDSYRERYVPMNWYNVQLEQRDGPKLNAHMRAPTAADAVRTALGSDRRWPVTESGANKAEAVDPEDLENWCRARRVERPASRVPVPPTVRKRRPRKPTTAVPAEK